MQDHPKNDLILSKIKNCAGLLGSLSDLTVVISPDLDLLWKNKKTAEWISDKGSKGDKCYKSLFGYNNPCMGCPVANPGDAAYDTPLVQFGNATFLVQTHPLADISGILVLHKDVSELTSHQNRLSGIIHNLPMGIILTDNELHKHLEKIRKG